jgi:hypothetical protein
MWRLRPLTFLPASQPRGPPLSVVFTDWLSITPALGLAARPVFSRAAITSSWLIRLQPGHWQAVAAMYWIASISRAGML